MRKYCKFLFVLFSCLTVSSLAAGCSSAQPPSVSKCLNLGNCLEAPKGEPWEVPIDLSYFKTIRDAGFECVRLPVRFSDYTGDASSGYRLEEDFMLLVDKCLEAAFSQNLTLILDLHHFQEIMEDPYGNEERFLSIWKQLASRYKDYPDTLVYELLNEPRGSLTSDVWNALLEKAVREIRSIDKTHYLIVGGSEYNSIDSLDSLILPGDKKLIVTVHYYEPNEVAFQNNEYHPEFMQYRNVEWTGTQEELCHLADRLSYAADWANKHDVPLFLGEFGVVKDAPRQTRLEWTRAVVRQAGELGVPWGYWEFASQFGIYDLEGKQWDEAFLEILIPHSGA